MVTDLASKLQLSEEQRAQQRACLLFFASASLAVAVVQGYLLGSPLRGTFDPVLLKGAHIDSLLTAVLLFGLGSSYRFLELSPTSLVVATRITILATVNTWIIGTITSFVGRPVQLTGELQGDLIVYYGLLGVALPQTALAGLWLRGMWSHLQACRRSVGR